MRSARLYRRNHHCTMQIGFEDRSGPEALAFVQNGQRSMRLIAVVL